jgi:hypothetical protein
MEPHRAPELLEKFISLANAKGAKFSHFTQTPNRRIRIHYHPCKRLEYRTRDFLNYTEALEHIYVAYNLKEQYYFEPLEAKRFDLRSAYSSAEEKAFKALIAELHPEKA